MIQKPFIWILLAAVSFAGCKMMAPFLAAPTVSFQQMRIQDMSLFDATLLFAFTVHNPNPVGATIRKGDYHLTIEDASMAKGTVDKPIRVAAGGSAPIEVPVHVNFMDLFNSINALALRDEVAYGLSGTFDVMGVSIPYNTQGKLALPEFPEISVTSLTVSELGLSGARINVVLSVANPNEFAVAVDGLRYALETGGMTLVDGSTQSLPRIEKNDRLALSVPVELDFLSVGRQAMRLLEGNTAPYLISGEMYFNVPGGGRKTLPFSKDGHVSLRR